MAPGVHYNIVRRACSKRVVSAMAIIYNLETRNLRTCTLFLEWSKYNCSHQDALSQYMCLSSAIPSVAHKR